MIRLRPEGSDVDVWREFMMGSFLIVLDDLKVREYYAITPLK